MKKLIFAASLTLLASGAQATTDIGGVQLPLDQNITLQGNFVQALIDYNAPGVVNPDGKSGFELQGYGNINIQQAPAFTFFKDLCTTPDCALTYTFEGLFITNPSQIAPITSSRTQLSFDASNARFNFWFHRNTPSDDFNIGSENRLQFDTDWATTYGNWNTSFNSFKSSEQYLETTSLGGVFTGIQDLNARSSADGFLEVLSQQIGQGWYFDREGSSLAPNGVATNPDISVTSDINRTFTTQGILTDSNLKLSASGTNSFSFLVPEPSTLAMFSVALLGFGAAARRRRQA